ncbi:hypothetical protein J4H86_05505 [Spiractinospora alimapuensis]|uniref:hypothetical protein n=1 Tax=Spiractinospora alimapuensis TaxID=2820884 RepID=UPI001F378186|nr:hypothetical protein [Spiractinospora alimapuensis]QVQ53235.1 hypothetical protein J4H86_05505 [Spiractinospora alimapuensis]
MSETEAGAPQRESARGTVRVLLYSHDAGVREQVRLAVGRRPAADVAEVEFVECATEPMVWRKLRAGEVDLMILDGEAQPVGGMGLCRQAKDEIYRCPPTLVLVGRADDSWLAAWSRAEAVASHPIDPTDLPAKLAELIREHSNRIVASS